MTNDVQNTPCRWSPNQIRLTTFAITSGSLCFIFEHNLSQVSLPEHCSILIKVYDSYNKHFGGRHVQYNAASGNLLKIHSRLFSSLKALFLSAIQTNINGNQLRVIWIRHSAGALD